MTRSSPRRERGSILVMTALTLTVLLGITALAIDASFMFDMRHRMEAAADAGALAAALEYQRAGSINSTLLWYAKKDITLHNFTPDVDVSVTMNHPPTSGAYVGNNTYVEIILSRSVPTFFMRLFGRSTMTVMSRSVAGLGISPNCIVALDGKAGDALSIEDGSDISSPGCNVVVNSSDKDHALHVKGGSLTARSISVTGGFKVDKGGTVSPTPVTGVSPITDPLAALVAPSIGSCIGPTPYKIDKNKTVTLDPGTYCGIEMDDNATLNLNPGIYVLNRNDHENFKTSDKGATITGTNVMIYSAGTKGKIKIDANADVTLTSQTTGTYAGILFFQSRTNKDAATFDEGTGYAVTGAFYFPKAELDFGNKKKKGVDFNTDCSLFVAQKLKFKKNADMVNTCSAFGNSPLHSITIAEDNHDE